MTIVAMRPLQRLLPLLPLLPVLLLLSGAILLAAAWLTPAYWDAAAYEAELERINSAYAVEEGFRDFDTMSVAFHAARDRYETVKWLLADIGYSCLAWAGLSAAVVLLASRRGWRVITHTHRNPLLIGVLLAGLILMGIGLVATGAHALGRDQVPWWADSFGIHLFRVAGAMLLLTPVMLIWTLIGFVRRGERFPLIARPSAPYWPTILITALFLPPLLWSLLMVAFFGIEGGWALSPAGALLTWLLLNSRGLLIAPRAA